MLGAAAVGLTLTACASSLLDHNASRTVASTVNTPAAQNAQARSSHASAVAITAGMSIGKPMLGQTRDEVAKGLSGGVRVGRGIYAYEQAGVTLKVTYARNGHVTSVEADSSKVMLLGQPLSRGYRYFEKRTNWSAVTCGSTVQLFHWAKRTHGETQISWNTTGTLTTVLIHAASQPIVGGGCGAGSS